MKEIVGKAKRNQDSFPKYQVIENNKLTNKTEISNIEPNFSAKISIENNKFDSYISENATSLVYSN